jgi:hypothetical protein
MTMSRSTSMKLFLNWVLDVERWALGVFFGVLRLKNLSTDR